MGQIVLQLSNETLLKMKETYHKFLIATPPGALFSARTANTTITAYKSGKVLFQGKTPEVEANKWGSALPNQKHAHKKKETKHRYLPDQDLFTASIIGSDEAGTGDYFGPITVSAAYVKSDQIELLKELGVRDSKSLSDQSILDIAQQIFLLEIPYSLMILPNPKYNQLQKEGWSQGKMKTMLHDAAINSLLSKISPIKPDGILIDQFSEPHVYLNHLKSENKILPDSTYFITKAESQSTAVATASIIARASFVGEISRLSKQVGFTLPKGASAKVDQAASYIIQKKGVAYLHNVAKVHFANTKKALSHLK
ncbi:ribonuclease HIII [Amphibacillus sp. MSJ-3]|uniref:ribonuclease HIII n=1 Tax=Amphibacillus sp. MSJ-3 TaxID=2841505 RepID=UPI001C0F004B|nr:ribonuclease HIII [Amphibacillus sp. MSJ-3]MBU5593629.1 ribonuclease HIII [Amphibacillus sp. MSJ-3]